MSDVTNRARRARERAGLSWAQACKLLGVTVTELLEIEERDSAFADANIAALADAYGVSVEWLAGEIPLCDYAAVDKINGADALSFHDRDVIAEFAASLPRKGKP